MVYKIIPASLLYLFLFSYISVQASAITKNGFEISDGLIKSEEILSGGPAKDGIPALSLPQFNPASQNQFIKDDDRVLGIVLGDTAKAYPIKILNWHEVVNDQIDDIGFAITYCPLCGTGVAFSSYINGEVLQFGVSGLLYNSDVLLYDRQTESLWSQILGQAVTGTFKGTTLVMIPLTHTSWKRWKEFHPDTLVLSEKTGYTRNYNRNPYADYAVSKQLYFPVKPRSKANLHSKETVLGITIEDQHKAYPFSTLKKSKKSSFSDTFNGKTYIIEWDEEENTAQAYDLTGEILPTIQGFWFAWYAFHPETELYLPNQ